MYKNNFNNTSYPQKGQVPPGLAAYQQQQRQNKMKLVNQYGEDFEDDENEAPLNLEKRRQSTRQPTKKIPIKKNINTSYIKQKLDEANYELLTIEERKKELKRLINRLNKELN